MGLVAGWAIGELIVLGAVVDAARFSRGAFEAARTYKRAWMAAFVVGIVVLPFGLLAVLAWLAYRPRVKRTERNRGVGGVGARRI